MFSCYLLCISLVWDSLIPKKFILSFFFFFSFFFADILTMVFHRILLLVSLYIPLPIFINLFFFFFLIVLQGYISNKGNTKVVDWKSNIVKSISEVLIKFYAWHFHFFFFFFLNSYLFALNELWVVMSFVTTMLRAFLSFQDTM